MHHPSPFRSFLHRRPLRLVSSSLLAAAFSLATVGQGLAAPAPVLANWYSLNTATDTFPKKADSVALGISPTLSALAYLGFTTNNDSRGRWGALSTAATLDPQQYLQYTVTTASRKLATVDSVDIGICVTDGTASVVARSSADNYATNLATTTATGSYATWNFPLNASLGSGQSLSVRIYVFNANGQGPNFINLNPSSLAAQFYGEVTDDPTPEPTPAPEPKPPATPKPGRPTINVNGTGKGDGRFTTKAGSYVLKGLGNNVDMIRWNFLGKGSKSVKVGEDSKWTVKIAPLKRGMNFVRISGVNSATGKASEVHKALIIRK